MSGTVTVATGHNQGTALAAFSPQPHYQGIEYAREVYSIDGDVANDGDGFVTLEWRNITEAQKDAILTSAGLTSAKTALVTLGLPARREAAGTWNGRAIAPNVGRELRYENPLYPRLVIVVNGIEGTA